MVSGRVLAIAAAIALAAIVGIYVWSPFHAAATLGQAVRSGDRDVLSIVVDFPSVRAGLKDQFAATLASRTAGDKAIGHNPLMLLPWPSSPRSPTGSSTLLSRRTASFCCSRARWAITSPEAVACQRQNGITAGASSTLIISRPST